MSAMCLGVGLMLQRVTSDVVGVVETVAVKCAGFSLLCWGTDLLCSRLAERVSTSTASAGHITWLRRKKSSTLSTSVSPQNQKMKHFCNSTKKKPMSFLPVHKGSRLPSLIAHSPQGREGGCCGPPQASSLGHTSSPPPAPRAHLQC